ncbi:MULTISPECIES: cation:proton antiporter [Staphylococcus]|uniref:cation:proton antiporter n=1 Tax=Staphylococcus TaxID=1279 RepID=UPI0008A3B037|nr:MULTISPECIES: sodium:proton antiporter [Staphylococcus]MBS6061067.1 sodium:proton antiporter [Staphylococcus sp.]MCI2922068.1 sodium:proton antiporter [Staphylococcus hominis]MDK7299640.1 sodium:proton antiporter [Staphylococcus hominis]MDS3912529.1 sodium:proton antiporter [Staphylococcus hominis]MDU0842957.1 sodium:proton antiporter [Staphylococcus sp.]
MELLEAFLLFILAVIISSIIYHRFPNIPTAFIQIALGVALFILPIPLHFKFEPEVFMMAVIAPLLFVEGTHVSREKLLEYRKPVVLMAMGLVFTTVIGVGFFIHWIWPNLPMPAAFAIAAILCPTDAVAVSAITKGKVLPKGSMAILEGESLLNDAAGIISFKIAVTALVTGSFSAINAIGQFLLSTFLGILVGAIIGALVVSLRVYLTSNKGLKDSNTLTFIQLLTPFVIYFIAEEVHASGIIAVVVAGLIHGLERDRLIRAQTELQMNYNQIWNTLSYALNGFVFVVLGYIVPEVILEIVRNEPQNLVFLIVVAFLIAFAIYIFRFIWVYVLFKDFYYPKNVEAYLDDEEETQPPKRSRYAFIMTLCGIHGTISLSMALTLPFIINGNQNFDHRNDLLFIASMMVLISLIFAQMILPFITPSEQQSHFKGMSYQSAKIFMIQHVIRTLKEKADTHKDIDYRPILNQYFNELSFLIDMESDDKNTKELHRLRDIAEDVETETLQQLIKQERITKKDLSDYRKVMELTQSFREMSFIEKLNRFSKLIILRFKARKDSRKSVNQSSFEQQRYTDRKELRHNFKKVQHIIRIVNRQVTLRLQEEQNSTNVLEVSLIINQYYALSRKLRQHHNRKRQSEENKFMYELNTQQQYDAKLDALYTQRQILDELISRNKVTNEIAAQLRENINYNEIVLAKELNH